MVEGPMGRCGVRTVKKIGPENNNIRYQLYLNGEPIAMDIHQILEIKSAPVSGETDFKGLDWIDFKIPGTITIQKRIRCRNRKRFVKLVMSMGHDRNYASRLAKIVQSMGISYNVAWLNKFLV